MVENKNPIQVADRLFSALETLAEHGPLTLAELQNFLQLNKSTVHRLLSSLSYMGYVLQEESGQYRLSFKLLSLSNKILDQMDILDTIRPYLKYLSEKTGETVHFVQIAGNEAVYIAKEVSYQNSVHMVSKVGSRIPLYCSGVGKALMAAMPPSQAKAVWSQSNIEKMTENTITKEEDLFQCLREIREKGYALDNEENELGVRCIAITIPWYDDAAKYALSISAPISRMSDQRIEELAPLLLEIKEKFMI